MFQNQLFHGLKVADQTKPAKEKKGPIHDQKIGRAQKDPIRKIAHVAITLKVQADQMAAIDRAVLKVPTVRREADLETKTAQVETALVVSAPSDRATALKTPTVRREADLAAKTVRVATALAANDPSDQVTVLRAPTVQHEADLAAKIVQAETVLELTALMEKDPATVLEEIQTVQRRVDLDKIAQAETVLEVIALMEKDPATALVEIQTVQLHADLDKIVQAETVLEVTALTEKDPAAALEIQNAHQADLDKIAQVETVLVASAPSDQVTVLRAPTVRLVADLEDKIVQMGIASEEKDQVTALKTQVVLALKELDQSVRKEAALDHLVKTRIPLAKSQTILI